MVKPMRSAAEVVKEMKQHRMEPETNNQINVFHGMQVVESPDAAEAIGVRVGNTNAPITISALTLARRIAEAGPEGLLPIGDNRIASFDLTQLRNANIGLSEGSLGRLTLPSMPEANSFLKPAPRDMTKAFPSRSYNGGPNAIFGREQKAAGYGARRTIPKPRSPTHSCPNQ